MNHCKLIKHFDHKIKSTNNYIYISLPLIASRMPVSKVLQATKMTPNKISDVHHGAIMGLPHMGPPTHTFQPKAEMNQVQTYIYFVFLVSNFQVV